MSEAERTIEGRLVGVTGKARVSGLEPAGQRLEAGDVTLLVDDTVPSHLRYAG